MDKGCPTHWELPVKPLADGVGTNADQKLGPVGKPPGLLNPPEDGKTEHRGMAGGVVQKAEQGVTGFHNQIGEHLGVPPGP